MKIQIFKKDRLLVEKSLNINVNIKTAINCIESMIKGVLNGLNIILTAESSTDYFYISSFAVCYADLPQQIMRQISHIAFIGINSPADTLGGGWMGGFKPLIEALEKNDATLVLDIGTYGRLWKLDTHAYSEIGDYVLSSRGRLHVTVDPSRKEYVEIMRLLEKDSAVTAKP